MDENQKKKWNKGGRKPKLKPATHRYVFRLTDEENVRFLTMFEKSGMHTKAKFITSVLFGKEIKTVQINMAAMDYYTRLTNFYSQFRNIGVNYNQVVKMLYRNFSERKAAAFLYKLEKQTAEMALLCQKIIQITEEFEAKYLKKQS
ncbi:conjugal transfer protein MobA [Sphingobacterium sp. 18053]|uniref:conjugal transfer protein MobA n=1 Tax=Sphingobacterium sp. 18053 TaxID=2681401 RepID=UPI001356B039|nr:conjugal transfer protein MobA [Sphingobacterium sp. 18053]